MNLNKLLCKHLDEDDKGEVTVKDVLVWLFWMCTPIILVAMYVHGAICMYNIAYTPDYIPHTPGDIPPSTIFSILDIAMFLLVSGIAMFEGLKYTIPRILGARIGKCERKDGD